MDTQNNQKLNILVVGASGNLGSLIVKHSLTKPNLIVNILVRDPQKNKDLTSHVEKAGGKVIVGDLAKPETLTGVTKGMHTIVFAVSFERNIVIDGQIAVIKDAVANGVKRIVPTDYTENFEKFSKEELNTVPAVVDKLQVREYLASQPIKTLRIDGAIFIETFIQMFMGKEFNYWGNADHKFQVTSYEDTARFIAAAVAKKEQDGHLVFVGDEVTPSETVAIYNKVRGANIVAKRAGSLDELEKLAEEQEKSGNPAAWFLRFNRLLFDERSRFDKSNNAQFPEVKPVSVEELLKQKPEIVV